MLPRQNHPFGWFAQNLGSVPAPLTLVGDFSFCFQCAEGVSLVLHRPIETTRITGQVRSSTPSVRQSELETDGPSPCYKFLMKIIEQWLLYKYVGLEFTPLSKAFKTKEAAEKARLKLPERERRTVAVGVIRIKK